MLVDIRSRGSSVRCSGVTGPPRRRADVVRPVGTREIDAETALGEVFMRSLLREQLFLALRVLAALGLTLGMLPLLFTDSKLYRWGSAVAGSRYNGHPGHSCC
mgnify:CR=1 FL=1